MSDNLLILYPQNPNSGIVEPDEIRRALSECSFTAETTIAFGKQHEMPGPRFLELLKFVDRPPAGELWAPHTVEIKEPNDSIQFLGGANTENPSCPSCSAEVPDWTEEISAWYDSDNRYLVTCRGCGLASPVWELDWHLTCGFGKQSIDVWHVGFKDAVPSGELGSVLERLGVGTWSYFYYHL